MEADLLLDLDKGLYTLARIINYKEISEVKHMDAIEIRERLEKLRAEYSRMNKLIAKYDDHFNRTERYDIWCLISDLVCEESPAHSRMEDEIMELSSMVDFNKRRADVELMKTAGVI